MNLTSLFASLMIALVVSLIVFQAMGAQTLDASCEHTLGENVTALEDQPLFDQQLDCVYPNGTVVEDVDPKPMNVTSQTG